MKRLAGLALVVSSLLAGCALAGDVTPPPAMATAQSAQASSASQDTLAPTALIPPAGGTEVAPVSPAAQTTPGATDNRGAVYGEVALGSDAGNLPAGLAITLHALDGTQDVIVGTTALTPQKSYSFGGLEVTSDRLYYVTAEWEGVTYPSEAGHLSDSQPGLALPLVVYDTSSDDSNVRIARLHLLYDFSVAGKVQVIELWVLSNVGDTAVVAVDREGGVVVALPSDVANLRFQEGESPDRFLLTDGGFVDTRPLVPGESTGQLVFSYDLPYDGELEFRRTMRYPLEAVVLLLPESNVQVEAKGLQDLGLRQMANEMLHQYSLGALEAGADLVLTLRGAPEGGEAADRNGALTGIAIGAGVFGLALIVAGLVWSRWSAGSEAEGDPARVVETDQQALLRAIAALDDDYAAGRVDEASYRSQREALKARVRSLMQVDRD
jgi:hypothetical protein